MRGDKENLQPGTQVRLVNNWLQSGVVTDVKPLMRRERRLIQVRFPDRVKWVYEDQLELQSEERMNPLDLLEKGKLGTPEDLRRTLTHVRLTGRLADIVYSMEATNTDTNRAHRNCAPVFSGEIIVQPTRSAGELDGC